MKFNEEILKKTGSQMGISSFTSKDGIKQVTLHHYSNWRIAKDVLSAGQIANVQKY